ncbi:aminoglycoside phosphotransferase family protein [Rathayibacter sp. VKM Ac-2929]|uniref:aminoglycoside phosphotransferase family protein n=1 Tax=Rathayibacter sp. VKM Ac-2929 TaxID=2929480 RepID=UPI001FB3F0F8|nr:aminoglycoside phosphotransferase family protein [Rathayibacter sp. VKM Ac-2929]MCJ1674109.1 aminoglycoside phosphotransferase family protein [Rathayibacter sp. VKM Ac-2929]
MVEGSPFSWAEYLAGIGADGAPSTPLAQQRNDLVLARVPGGRELVLKRGRKRTEAGDGALLSEGLTYQLLKELGVADIAPRCILHDREHDVLVLEHLPGKTAREGWQQVSEEPQEWARVGSTLAHLHLSSSIWPAWAGRLLGEYRDLIPSAEPITPRELVRATPGQLRTMSLIQADEQVGVRLEELASTPPSCLIHGDLRLDNVLLDPPGRPRLIDFELARIGDPLFDLGTLVGSMIERAASARPQEDDERASQLIERAASSCSDQVQAVVAGYRATARLSGSPIRDPEEHLSLLASHAGVHLLHRSGALAQLLHGETRQGRLYALLGCMILMNPSTLLRPLGLDASYLWQRNRERTRD